MRTGCQGRVKIRPSAVGMAIGLALWTLRARVVDGTEMITVGMLIAWGLAALCHEGGHLLAALLCRVKVRSVTLDLLGARMHLEGLLSYRQEWLIAGGGPAANLLAMVVWLPLWLYRDGCGHPFLGWFLLACGGLAVVNLLPISTLDGGRLLFCPLAARFGDTVARRWLLVTTTVVLLFLWLLSAYALLRSASQLSLFVFTLSLMSRLWNGDAGA